MTDMRDIEAFLYQFWRPHKQNRLDKMRLLAERLGSPQEQYPIIHVAGTNGKGSVCAMLESVLRGAGYRVGLFTSPHLKSLAERVQVGRENIKTEGFLSCINKIKPIAEELGREETENYPYFFEWITAIGLLYFAEQAVDVAIIETGLGGAYDSTNIVTPDLSIITSIGIDHEDYLGTGIANIVEAKAGIIKTNTPVVLGVLSEEAEGLMRKRAEACQATVLSVKEVFGVNIEDYPRTNLHGRFQQMNAATATLACGVLEKKFPKIRGCIEQGLQSVAWVGRWQEVKLGFGPRLIFDAAHNEEGALALAENLADLKVKMTGKLTVVVGVSGEKRAKVLLSKITEYADEIILVQSKYPMASSLEVLKAAIPIEYQGLVRSVDISSFFNRKKLMDEDVNPSDVIVTAGSVHLVGEAMDALGLLDSCSVL